MPENLLQQFSFYTEDKLIHGKTQEFMGSFKLHTSQKFTHIGLMHIHAVMLKKNTGIVRKVRTATDLQ